MLLFVLANSALFGEKVGVYEYVIQKCDLEFEAIMPVIALYHSM